MPEDLAGQGQVERHEQGGPDDGVELGDVLADQVQLGGPPVVEARHVGVVADARQIVGEGVDPDVDDLRLVAGHRDAPAHVLARDRDVGEGLEQVQQLVAARLGLQEHGVLLDVGPDPVAVVRELEDVVLLAGPLDGLLVLGADLVLGQVALVLELFAALAVPAFVLGLEDIALVQQALEDALDRRAVGGIAGTDEPVVANVEGFPDLLGLHGDVVHEGLGGDTRGVSGLLDLVAVLVETGQEEDLLAAQPVVAREGIGGDLLVGMPDVRRRVAVVDRRGDVVLLRGHAKNLLTSAKAA
ncbi:hypothetical protein D3C86_1149710 [compost metagenome]